MEIVSPQEVAVQLDGSTELTIARIATVCQAHDRVSVLIKDHKAIVTGNLTNPASASSESSYIRILPDGSILIGRLDEHGDPIGFYVQATGDEYMIKDGSSGNAIINVTDSGIDIFGSGAIDGSSILTSENLDAAVARAVDRLDVTNVGNKFTMAMQAYNKRVTKLGSRIDFNLEVYGPSMSTNTWNTVGSIDSTIRPETLMYYPGVITQVNGFTPIGTCILRIQTTGTISAYTSESDGYMFFSGSYDIH